jgi:hypothetical protein
MDENQFKKYKNRNPTRRTFWKNELSQMIVTDSQVNTLDLPINNPKSFSILFTYLNPTDTVPDAATQYGYINSFFDGFNELITRQSYTPILNHTIDSIDVFGLGFTLQFMANCFKRLNALSLEDYTLFVFLISYLFMACMFIYTYTYMAEPIAMIQQFAKALGFTTLITVIGAMIFYSAV